MDGRGLAWTSRDSIPLRNQHGATLTLPGPHSCGADCSPDSFATSYPGPRAVFLQSSGTLLNGLGALISTPGFFSALEQRGKEAIQEGDTHPQARDGPHIRSLDILVASQSDVP